MDGGGYVVPARQCMGGCQYLAKSRFISGPGWVIPADTYVHDAGVDML